VQFCPASQHAQKWLPFPTFPVLYGYAPPPIPASRHCLSLLSAFCFPPSSLASRAPPPCSRRGRLSPIKLNQAKSSLIKVKKITACVGRTSALGDRSRWAS
jgi:hypothetical protein